MGALAAVATGPLTVGVMPRSERLRRATFFDPLHGDESSPRVTLLGLMNARFIATENVAAGLKSEADTMAAPSMSKPGSVRALLDPNPSEIKAADTWESGARAIVRGMRKRRIMWDLIEFPEI